MKLTKCLIGLSMLLALVNCRSQELTYDYLMRHPVELQDEYTHCADGQSDDSQCKVIQQAAADFLHLVEQRNNDPEEFGIQIMQIQTALAKQTDPELIQKEKQRLQVMYAVISATNGD